MYIEPNSRIILLGNTPMNPRQTDTYWFSSYTQQFNTFYGMKIAEFTRQSYQRVERGRIRLEINAERVYSCNYCMFQNSAYGDKWFYAFVTAVEYINDNCTEFTFVIDDIQTWFFEHTIPSCFVERQHSYTDGIGDNIEPEPVDAGELVPNDYIPLHETYASQYGESMNDKMIVVSYIDPEVSSITDVVSVVNYWKREHKGQMFNGVFTTGTLMAYNSASIDEIAKCAKFVNEQMVVHPESIISMYMCPKWAIGTSGWWNANTEDIISGSNIPISRDGQQYDFTLPVLRQGASLNGYIPRNNKLYTYPYNCLQLTTGAGDNMALRYEFFKDLTPTFREYWNLLEPVSSTLRPTNYRNITESSKDLGLTLDKFPMCMWSGDAYKAWIAQNSVGIGVDIASIMAGIGMAFINPLGIAGTALLGMKAGAVMSTVSTVGGLLNDAYKANISADVVGGKATGSNAWANNQLDYFATRMSCNFDVAQSIDDFFSAFGYAQKKVMKPNIHVRRNFTYVKTVGADCIGLLPADSKVAISNMYDNGIRFWTTFGKFGDIQADNPPLSL